MWLFMNNAMRWNDKYILKYKSEAVVKLNKWNALRGNVSGNKVMRFHKDGDGEHIPKKFAYFLKSERILQVTTMPYTLQYNGLFKQANHTIIEHICCMLHIAGILKKSWAFAVWVVIDFTDHTATCSVFGITQCEVCYGQKPFLNHRREFSCLAFMYVLKGKQKKLYYWATSGRVVGYSISTKQY